VAADAGPAVSATSAAATRPIAALSRAECVQLNRRMERELAAAQRCKADDECISIIFEYAFRPCGDSARKGASLDKITTHAKIYVDRCQPILRPVKCAHRTLPVCARGRCALTTPPGE